MNIKEFAALKVGDRIENHASGGVGTGEIVEATDSGVRVVWGPRHDREHKFFYSVVGTSWLEWSNRCYKPLNAREVSHRREMPSIQTRKPPSKTFRADRMGA